MTDEDLQLIALHRERGTTDCRQREPNQTACKVAPKAPSCVHLGQTTHRVRQSRTGCGGPTQLYVCTLHGDEVTRRPLTQPMADGSTGPTDAAVLLRDRGGVDYRPAFRGRSCATCADRCEPDFRNLAIRGRFTIDAGPVTLACIDCVNPDLAALALDYSRRGMRFARIMLLSDVPPQSMPAAIEFVRIGHLDYQGYNLFCLRDLHGYIATSHVLTVQTDGWVLFPQAWKTDWLTYDYLGARWPGEKANGHVSPVGNSGLCLRSRRLLQATAELLTPEREADIRSRRGRVLDDITTCKELYRDLCARGLTFAPVGEARRFSAERYDPKSRAFGYHGKAAEPTAWLASQLPPPAKPTSAPPAVYWHTSDGLPSSPRLHVVTVCRTSDRYTPAVVQWLRRQVSLNLRTPHTFTCLTDRPNDVPGGVPLLHDWPRWWAKLELFRPGLFPDGDQVLYLDLDTVLTRPTDAPPCPDPGDLGMVGFGGGWWTHYGSGVMTWLAPMTAPYDFFRRRPAEAMRWFPSDQEVIGPAVFNAGGTISAVPGCSVQEHNGTAHVPQDRPTAPVWCAAGSGAKPWEVARSWIPPLSLPAVIQDTALITCWFGRDRGLRLDAAYRATAALSRLSPRPAASLLVEATADGTTVVPWHAERLDVPIGDEHAGLWLKEGLLNLGATHILARYPAVRKLLFVDVDVHPAHGYEDWAAVTSAALDSCDVCHPWCVVRESDESGSWISYSAQVAVGKRDCQSGQGFAIAMTADWWRRCGGWPAMAVAGSGDAIACLRWDADRSHANIYRGCRSVTAIIAEYTGPRTRYGACGGELVHEWHGDRTGPSQTRNYETRHQSWDLIGSVGEAVTLDGRGLPTWRTGCSSRKVRKIVEANPRAREETMALWNSLKEPNNGNDGNQDAAV